jgi:hypothetical protein
MRNLSILPERVLGCAVKLLRTKPPPGSVSVAASAHATGRGPRRRTMTPRFCSMRSRGNRPATRDDRQTTNGRARQRTSTRASPTALRRRTRTTTLFRPTAQLAERSTTLTTADSTEIEAPIPDPVSATSEAPAGWRTHPDRLAETLAAREMMLADAATTDEPDAADEPGPHARAERSDARVDLRLARYATARALERAAEDPSRKNAPGLAAARARFAALDSPQFRAGTVRDGTARGLLVAYEEIRSLCGEAGAEAPEGETTPAAALAPPPAQPKRRRRKKREHDDVPVPPSAPPVTDLDAILRGRGVRTPSDLRRLRDVAIASGGSRIRWTRREGLALIDRAAGLHAPSFLWFENRRDAGDLDGFRPARDDRPRRYVVPSLHPQAFAQDGDGGSELLLAGRLGRGRYGFPIRMRIVGRPDRDRVLIELAVFNDHDDHRLRARFLGLTAAACVSTEGSPPVVETVSGGRIEHAMTLVRACTRLRIDEPPRTIPVPGAACRGWIVHRLWVGGPQRTHVR